MSKLWQTDQELLDLAKKELFEEAFRKALEKSRGEQKVAVAIKRGMSAVKAWETYGIM